MKRENVTMVDTKGVVYKGRKEGMNKYKERFAQDTELRTLAEALPREYARVISPVHELIKDIINRTGASINIEDSGRVTVDMGAPRFEPPSRMAWPCATSRSGSSRSSVISTGPRTCSAPRSGESGRRAWP